MNVITIVAVSALSLFGIAVRHLVEPQRAALDFGRRSHETE
jgi:hypothetical protein